MSEPYQSLSIYDTDEEVLFDGVVVVKVPKAPSDENTSTIVTWVDAHTQENRDGSVVEVPAHLRHRLKVQNAYNPADDLDGLGAGRSREAVVIHRNFFIGSSLCGKTMPMRVLIRRKHTLGEVTNRETGETRHVDSINIVIDHHPVPEGTVALTEMKFPEERKSDDDIHVPGTESRYIHFAEITPYVPKHLREGAD